MTKCLLNSGGNLLSVEKEKRIVDFFVLCISTNGKKPNRVDQLNRNLRFIFDWRLYEKWITRR